MLLHVIILNNVIILLQPHFIELFVKAYLVLVLQHYTYSYLKGVVCPKPKNL